MFDWTDYLKFARNLLTSPPGPPEAAWRAAGSRAYYAALHKSREFLGIREQTSHAEVINGLKQRPETETTARVLERVRGKHLHADYNSGRPFAQFDAETAVELATEVIHRLPSVS